MKDEPQSSVVSKGGPRRVDQKEALWTVKFSYLLLLLCNLPPYPHISIHVHDLDKKRTDLSSGGYSLISGKQLGKTVHMNGKSSIFLPVVCEDSATNNIRGVRVDEARSSSKHLHASMLSFLQPALTYIHTYIHTTYIHRPCSYVRIQVKEGVQTFFSSYQM